MKDRIIIRNVPDCQCYKDIVRAFLLGSGICEKDSDIIELNSGMIIAERKKCYCQYSARTGGRLPVQIIQEANQRKQNAIQDCKWWCDKGALGWTALCVKYFKRWECQTSCIYAVDFVKDGCYWCCSEGDFYEKCIKPFDDVLKYMRQPCEPSWD